MSCTCLYRGFDSSFDRRGCRLVLYASQRVSKAMKTSSRRCSMTASCSPDRTILARDERKNGRRTTSLARAALMSEPVPLAQNSSIGGEPGRYGEHDHPLRSGAREQGIRRGTGVQKAAIEQAPEDVLALPAAIEPVAVLVEVGLQVARADAVEDVKRPALEVGEHDVREGQPRVDVGACRGVAGQMSVAGALKAGVAVPAVGLHQAAGDDRGESRPAQAGGAGVGDDAQVGAPEAAARGVPRGHGDQRLAGLAAAAALRPLVLAADEALVELDEAAQQMLALAARHGMDDLAAKKPGGLARHAELTGQLGGRGRLLGGGEQPDGEKPLAQVGTRAGEDRAGGQRTLVVAAGALIELSLIHISEPTRLGMISYAVFCLKKKKTKKKKTKQQQNIKKNKKKQPKKEQEK